jgi:hypothetical protein
MTINVNLNGNPKCYTLELLERERHGIFVVSASTCSEDDNSHTYDI